MTTQDREICARNSERYDAGFKRLLESKGVPAYSIAVAKGSSIVYRLHGGHLHPESGAGPVRENTRFNVGSVSKPITGAALVLLLEEGRLTLDDPVVKHIPEYRYPQVTLLNLLTHSAGYDPAFGIDVGFPSRAADVPGFLGRLYERGELCYEPGTSSAYFTLGYAILMDVVERVSGMPFESFVRQRLFDPLGMFASTFDAARLADSPYVLPWDGSRNEHLREEAMTPVMGDRGLFTTADDLVKFGYLFLNGRDNGRKDGNLSDGDNANRPVFSPAALRLMIRELPGMSPGKTPVFWRKGLRDEYGFFGDACSSEALGHTGFTGCMLLVDPACDTVAALLTNSVDWHGDWRNYRLLCNLAMALPNK
ncbi:serine hydrolase domain-containing protein [Cohnella sp.]|uniref:serine hydrolase domain-containing protein n=1 Tax=Cohnella sp. TaxID=1883426 RepID=UPI003703CECA